MFISQSKSEKKYCPFQKKNLLETTKDANFEQTIQIFNQNILNSTEIRDLNNVQYEAYQNSNALLDESNMKIFVDVDKEEEKRAKMTKKTIKN